MDAIDAMQVMAAANKQEENDLTAKRVIGLAMMLCEWCGMDPETVGAVTIDVVKGQLMFHTLGESK